MELIKPTNLTELQTLTNYILEGIGDRGKITVKLMNFGSLGHGLIQLLYYIRTGRRNMIINKHYFETYTLKRLVNLIIHEIAHFKQSKTQKLRRQYLKHNSLSFNNDLRMIECMFDLHTKAFEQLVNKLETKFYDYHNNK